MRTHQASTSSSAVSLAIASVLLALALVLAACGGSRAAVSSLPSTAPNEATVMVAASPSATPLPKGAGPGTIAFTRLTGDAPPDIYVVRSDGTGLRRLAEGARGPAWSPDSSKIAYTRVTGSGGVWVMNADGSGQRRVMPALAEVYGISWSPDGTQIVLSYADDLAIVNTDGGGLEFVATGSSRVTGFSPAGRRTGGSSSPPAARTWAGSAPSGPTARG